MKLKDITWLDYFIFIFLIPSLLLLMYLLPNSIKNNYLILDPLNPSFISVLLSNYVHSDLSHFFGNVIVYLIAILLILKLNINRRLLYMVSLLLFVLLPLISSLAVIHFLPRLPKIQGFSAIVSGFIGFFVYIFVIYLKEIRELEIDTYQLLSLILMINLTIVGVFNLSTPIFSKVILVIFTFILMYATRKSVKELFSLFQEILKEGVYSTMMFSLSFVYLFLLPLLIPKVVIMKVAIINTFAHYIGYIFGVSVPLILEKTVLLRGGPSKVNVI